MRYSFHYAAAGGVGGDVDGDDVVGGCVAVWLGAEEVD
jgi:hypothetical protein